MTHSHQRIVLVVLSCMAIALLWPTAYSSSAPASSTTTPLLLPCPYPCLVEAQSVSLSGDAPDIEVDQQGAIHLVWAHSDSPFSLGVYYSQRLPGNFWSAPLQLGAGTSPKVAVSLDQVVHVAWITNNYRLNYRQRSALGSWSDTSDLGPANPNFALAVDSQGGVHILFDCYSVAGCPSDQVFYLERLLIGSWLAAQPVADRSKYSALAIGPDDSIHIVWQRYSQGLFYRRRDHDGQWTEPEKAGGEGYSIYQQRIVVDNQGSIHIFFTEPTSGYYTSRPPGGTWTSAPLSHAYGTADLVVDNQENLYLVGISNIFKETGTYYRSKMRSSDWSEPVLINASGSENDLPTITVDSKYHVHIIESQPFNNMALRYLTSPTQLNLPYIHR